MERIDCHPEHPLENASFMKKWTYWWLNNLFKLGMQRSLDMSDIYKPLNEHKSGRLANQFEQLWNEETKMKRPRLFNVIRKIYAKKIIGVSILFTVIDAISRAIQPLCLGGFVTYFSQSDNAMKNNITNITEDWAYLYAAGIVLCTLITMIFSHPFNMYAWELGMELRVSCCSLMFRKTMRLTKSFTVDGLNGRIINLMSNDVLRFNNTMLFLHYLWKGPLEILAFSYFLYREIGWYAFIGIGFILCFVPIQLLMGKKSASYRLKTTRRTDLRVRIMNEIIQGIQIIKMYAWESSFAKIVDKMRIKELSGVRGTLTLKGILFSFTIISRFSVFLSLATYVFCGNVFTARQVFMVTSYFNFLYNSMLYFWPVGLTSLAESFISIKRIQQFLLLPESKAELREDEESLNETTTTNKFIRNSLGGMSKEYLNHGFIPDTLDCAKLIKYPHFTCDADAQIKKIEFKNVTAFWSRDDESGRITGIKNINLKITDYEMCAIIGSVGSGKSTMLQALLHEIEIDSGELLVNGRISYASQEPWLFEGTVRQNIIFTEPYDENRYKDVIRVCALERDMHLLPYSDYTIVGERGTSLSGGQRARINLARAIYRKADIYLLDDPLSAVDTLVGKHIFDQCITSYLADTICVLVTHQQQYLKRVGHVVLMNDGTIEAQGTFSDIQQTHYTKLRRMSSEHIERLRKDVSDNEDSDVECEHDDGELSLQMENRKEQRQIGSIGWKIYKSYFKSIENRLLVFMVGFLIVLCQIAISGIDWFVAKWTNWETDIGKRDVTILTRFMKIDVIDPDAERFKFAYIYSAFMLIVLYLVFQRANIFFNMCLRAARNIHEKLFYGVIRAKMYFFGTNSSGRIINRFSKDILEIDTVLPIAMYDSFVFFAQLTAVMILVSITNYWLLIPTTMMSIVFYILRSIYVCTGRSIKRIESMSRSPIISHTNTSVNGMATIRACKAENIVSNEFDLLQDINTSAYYMFGTSSRALALWLDTVCLVYMAAVILIFLLLGKEAIGGNVGLAITQIFNLIMMSQWGMRQTADLENCMTSVERVCEYIDLEPEPMLEVKEEKLSKEYEDSRLIDWPLDGKIEFINLSLKYSENDEFILKNLTMTIKTGEKIGIVGRTGAGKSSIIQAIFRLATLEGSIKIDGIDTSTIGLHTLRRNISIIPQDPVLFTGTMRDNLDPFHKKSDDDLWKALDQVELRSVVSSMPNGLDCKMCDGGSNLSMGQRQLVCLARAILRSNKILILDEATANVDANTDKFVQRTIREKFANCTVLTIAHRLHTVMESDRVLVMEAGEIVEFDHAHNLLKQKGFLRRLVDETGFSTASQLLQMAKKSFQHKNQINENE